MYSFILAQTRQNVNGYKLRNYDIKTVAFIRLVRYYRYAPVWTFKTTRFTTNTILVFCEIREYKNNALERALFCYRNNYYIAKDSLETSGNKAWKWAVSMAPKQLEKNLRQLTHDISLAI